MTDDHATTDLDLERRRSVDDDVGERRRRADREEAFRLFRDKVLLTVGVVGVLGLAIVAVTVGVKNEGLALAALTVFAGLLGAPTVLRLDERRQRGR